MQPHRSAHNAELTRVSDYHERTKHRLERYAPGPDTLDWDAAPAPFRTYCGTEHIRLPLLEELCADHPARVAMERAYRPTLPGPPNATMPWSVATLGVLLQCSLGITAWKSYGPDRWAVRANPSSGNLHPVEAYVLCAGIPELPDGVYHYEAQTHALELRARPVGPTPTTSQAPGILALALSCVMWREAWKYGERAFRYCQLDTGHAMAALSVAAAALGARLVPDRTLDSHELGALLGVDRTQDFPALRARYTELEEPETMLALRAQTLSDASIERRLPQASLRYAGVASTIDARPMYDWPVISQVAALTRALAPGPPLGRVPHMPDSAATADADVSAHTLAQVILGRRSAQRFDIRYQLCAHAFADILRATLPASGSPWDVLDTEPRIELVLFVHRVQGLAPGLYLFRRAGPHGQALLSTLARSHHVVSVELALGAGQLLRLAEAEPRQLMRVARAVHCHQDIASNSCFALGMLADLDTALHDDGYTYRQLLREAGVIGQQLYLAAESVGLRGTGIGCYFDDAFHELLGLSGSAWQSLYHFTVGHALDDSRIETGPAYPQRRA